MQSWREEFYLSAGLQLEYSKPYQKNTEYLEDVHQGLFVFLNLTVNKLRDKTQNIFI